MQRKVTADGGQRWPSTVDNVAGDVVCLKPFFGCFSNLLASKITFYLKTTQQVTIFKANDE